MISPGKSVALDFICNLERGGHTYDEVINTIADFGNVDPDDVSDECALNTEDSEE